MRKWTHFVNATNLFLFIKFDSKWSTQISFSLQTSFCTISNLIRQDKRSFKILFDATETNWNESHLTSGGVNCCCSANFSLNAATTHQTEYVMQRWSQSKIQTRDRKNLIKRRINILSDNHTRFWSRIQESALNERQCTSNCLALELNESQCFTFPNFIVRRELFN